VLSSLADACLEPFLATLAPPFDFPSSFCPHIEPYAFILSLPSRAQSATMLDSAQSRSVRMIGAAQFRRQR
jgi:hypothetical protein